MPANMIGRLSSFLRKNMLQMLMLMAFFAAMWALFTINPQFFLYALLISMLIGSTVFLVHVWRSDLDSAFIGYDAEFHVDFRKAFGKGKFKEFTFDEGGVPMHEDQDGRPAYFPTFVAWHAIACLQKYRLTGKKDYLLKFRTQIRWLAQNSRKKMIGGREARVWFYDFGWRESTARLGKPWISALGQGAAISALVQGHKELGDDSLLRTAELAALPFEAEIESGGIRFVENRRVFYEEYPAKPYSKVFDGFAFSVLGLYDLWQASKNQKYHKLFLDGAETLEAKLPFWDFKHMWSMYGRHGILCSRDYNKLNSVLCRALFRITGKNGFRTYASYWNPSERSFADKLRIVIWSSFLKYKYVVRNLFAGGNF